MSEPLDPVCLIHGKKLSEHHCLYCALCFTPLTPDECNIRPDGFKEDVCKPCAQAEALRTGPGAGSDKSE